MSTLLSSVTRATSRTHCSILWWQKVSGCCMAYQATDSFKDALPAPTRYFESGALNAPHTQYGLLPVRGKRRAHGLQKVKELEQKVQALEEAIKADALAFNPLTYREEELLAIYEDVLSFPLPDPPEADKSPSLPLIESARENVDRMPVEGPGQRLFGDPAETQRHHHVRAHLKATPSNTIPISALDLLHHYEQQNTPAPLQTYTSVITHLFCCSSSVARSQAWDIFSHMRYVAHPIPDVVLYTLMIRACASPVTMRYSSEPEKALDLWTEMTTDQNITPTVGAYNAIILACARSGTKAYVNEAFRLARQMLDSHRDGRGFSPFRPNKRTFCALLEGAKRIGDLGRARWILAEMVKGGGVGVEVEIDEEVMVHVFNAYASYKVPSLRTPARFVRKDHPESSSDQLPSSPSGSSNIAPQLSNDSRSRLSSSLPTVESDEPLSSFSHMPPLSRGEVIREVTALFRRILEDRTMTSSPVTSSLPFEEKKFGQVDITTRLLNAYLSVFYKHAELSVAQEMFWHLFEDMGLTRSTRTYLEALGRCANTSRKVERNLALSFAKELWFKWQQLEEAGIENGSSLNPRLIERAHVSMIRTLAINENLTQAMTHLRAFATKYPPNSVRTPSPKLYFQSTRTSLVGSRPLVRMTSASDMIDDNVPPMLTFRDLELLHHRLVDEGMNKDIKYVTWLCKAYEWALRVRRDEAIKAKPVVTEEKSLV